jgi:hypothetical protein
MSAATDINRPAVLSDITLLVFSCEGRAHLLRTTMESFRRQCPFTFGETIYAHDGPMDPAAPSFVNPGRLVQNCQRRGYVQSILQALAVVRTPYVFWLEDDWEFTQPIDLPGLHAAMAAHPGWLQIRLSKTAPLAEIEAAAPLDSAGLHQSGYGFSANPHLGRAEPLRAGFAAFSASPKTTANTFESFLEGWVKSSGLVCVVVNPGPTASIQHTGYLESTGRQWHAASSLGASPGAEYSSGMRGVGEQPPVWRRIVLALRLVAAAAKLAVKALRGSSAYDLAFRFIAMTRQEK